MISYDHMMLGFINLNLSTWQQQPWLRPPRYLWGPGPTPICPMYLWQAAVLFKPSGFFQLSSVPKPLADIPYRNPYMGFFGIIGMKSWLAFFGDPLYWMKSTRIHIIGEFDLTSHIKQPTSVLNTAQLVNLQFLFPKKNTKKSRKSLGWSSSHWI